MSVRNEIKAQIVRAGFTMQRHPRLIIKYRLNILKSMTA